MAPLSKPVRPPFRCPNGITLPYVPHYFGTDVVARTTSRRGWLTAAVASSIPWPKEDVLVEYDGHEYLLRCAEADGKPFSPNVCTPCPGSSEAEIDDALARVLRFASILGWYLRGYVDVAGHMWGSFPSRFGMASALSSLGWGGKYFNCNHLPVVRDESLRKALAFFREGCRLQHVSPPYSFLSFFKVLESQFSAKDRVTWVADSIDRLEEDAKKRVDELRGAGIDVSKHIFESGRCAVAHASIGAEIVDPDVPSDRRRIQEDLDIIKALAARFLLSHAGVPTQGEVERRDKTQPLHTFMNPAGVAQLQAGAALASTDDVGSLEGAVVDVRLWPHQADPELKGLTLLFEGSGPGWARFVAVNQRKTLELKFALHVADGEVHALVEESGLAGKASELTEAEVRAFHYYFHSVVGNARVELVLPGTEPVDCEIVIPVNIIPQSPSEATEKAVAEFKQRLAAEAGEPGEVA